MKNHNAAPNSGKSPYWFEHHARSVIFLIITLALVGCYLAFTVPVDVFPATNFPRVLIGVDNGVMPIDQMMVTITRRLKKPSTAYRDCRTFVRSPAVVQPKSISSSTGTSTCSRHCNM